MVRVEMVVAVRWRRGVIGAVVVLSTAEAARGRQGVVVRVVVRVRVWQRVGADMSG